MQAFHLKKARGRKYLKESVVISVKVSESTCQIRMAKGLVFKSGSEIKNAMA